jgi:hypothetical protein
MAAIGLLPGLRVSQFLGRIYTESECVAGERGDRVPDPQLF